MRRRAAIKGLPGGLREPALESRHTMIRDLAVDTPWWDFREEPGYRALLGRMGLSATAG